ncbi:hypothetical protein MUP07_00880 [Candidatus Bathyarchaeota archaeon]|nr:hypothetical protein [Candidatus Bathyarchaeota archaeon]
MSLSTKVFVTEISAERLWDITKPLPPHVDISVNLNVLDVKRVNEATVRLPFIFTVEPMPSLCRLAIKGTAFTEAPKGELDKLVADYKTKKHISLDVLNGINSVVLVEAILVCRAIGVPPPIPLPRAVEPEKPTNPPETRQYG